MVGQWSMSRSMEPYLSGTGAPDPTPGALVPPSLSLSPPSSSCCYHLSWWESGCREGQGPMRLPWCLIGRNGGGHAYPGLATCCFQEVTQRPSSIPNSGTECVPMRRWHSLGVAFHSGLVGIMPCCKGRCLACLYCSWPRLCQTTSW